MRRRDALDDGLRCGSSHGSFAEQPPGGQDGRGRVLRPGQRTEATESGEAGIAVITGGWVVERCLSGVFSWCKRSLSCGGWGLQLQAGGHASPAA